MFDNDTLLKHLIGMVQIPTISRPEPEVTDYGPFTEFQNYLEKTYPLVHRTFTKEIIGISGLLYHWKGTGKSGKLPILLSGHQDVVPPGDPSGWTYPPFEGKVADGFVWGRGTDDCKKIIMAHMEALEALIAEGFVPDYDIYLAYGYNEECSTEENNSAKKICAELKSRGVELGLVMDEGSGATKCKLGDTEVLTANILVGEKGYADVEFSISDKGGHSMYAGNTSIIARLGQVAIDLCKEPFPYCVTEVVANEYKVKAPYLGEIGKLLADPAKNLEALIPWIEANPMDGYKFHTNTAITMISGSERANALPTKAAMVVNFRPIEGDTVDVIMEKCRRIAGEGVEVRLIKGYNATTVSSADSTSYKCLKAVTEKLNPGVVVAPVICPGGTDARNYHPICKNVYRYSGYPLRSDANAHTFNEKLPVDNLYKGPELIYELVKAYGSFEA